MVISVAVGTSCVAVWVLCSLKCIGSICGNMPLALRGCLSAEAAGKRCLSAEAAGMRRCLSAEAAGMR